MCFDEEDNWRICGCVLNLAILPVVCVFGLALNSMCLLVFIKVRKHPLVPVLILLSICDILQLFLSLLVLFVPALHDFTDAEPYGVLGQIAYLSTGLLSPLLLASNCASIWTITYISIQRHQAITNPLRNIRSPPKTVSKLVVITGLALIFNASKWLEYDWKWVQVTEEKHWFVLHEPSVLAQDERYHRMFDYFLYPVCVYIVPLLVLTLLHIRIFFHISLRRLSSDHKSRLNEERRSLTLLIAIVILFFFCHTGGIAWRFASRPSLYDKEWFVFIKDVVNLLFNINSLCNPMLYFFFTRQFRDLRGNLLNKPTLSRRGSFINVRSELNGMSTPILQREIAKQTFARRSY